MTPRAGEGNSVTNYRTATVTALRVLLRATGEEIRSGEIGRAFPVSGDVERIAMTVGGRGA